MRHTPGQRIAAGITSTADARLIAAAPELLEALRAFADYFGPLSDNKMLHDDARHCFRLARAAIAKATGEDKPYDYAADDQAFDAAREDRVFGKGRR